MASKGIPRSLSSQLVSLFDVCYRQGVMEACEYGDDYFCAEFVSKRKKDAEFGLLDVDETIMWQEWKYYLGKFCRQNRITKLCQRYIDKVSKINYMWCVLPISFDFYLSGIKAWTDYPDASGIEPFKRERRTEWGTKKCLSKDDYVGMVQNYCFERGRTEKDIDGKPSAVTYYAFGREMWRITRVLPRDPLDIELENEEED